MSEIQTESRKALRELLELLGEVDRRWASPEWNLQSEDDVAGAHRALAHMLETAFVTVFDDDPSNPRFQRIVSPTRKLTGDNPDAIYFDAAVSPRHRYVVRGRMDGAVYVSLTVECGTADGTMGNRTAGVLNDTQFDVDAEGRFEVYFGGEQRERNWLPLDEEATRITTRHYYENETAAAADPERNAALAIERLDEGPPPPRPDDGSIAAGFRRAARFIESRTLLQKPMAQNPEQPPFVSIVPNEFPAPVVPGDFGLAAFDAAYSMAPYVIGPDDALVMTGRWPTCRMGNVSLWNRHMQTFDYAHRQISRNRVQTKADSEGRFEMVLAHRDPGHPNWIDTEGRAFGLVFWRFMLPEGDIETPRATVVPFAEIAKG